MTSLKIRLDLYLGNLAYEVEGAIVMGPDYIVRLPQYKKPVRAIMIFAFGDHADWYK